MRWFFILATAVPAFFGYYFMPTAADRPWAYYVAEGALILALADMVRGVVPQLVRAGVLTAGKVQAAVGLLWWIEIEAGQQAVCGALAWGQTAHSDVCVDLVGLDVYRAVAALAVAGALAIWQNQQP